MPSQIRISGSFAQYNNNTACDFLTIHLKSEVFIRESRLIICDRLWEKGALHAADNCSE